MGKDTKMTNSIVDVYSKNTTAWVVVSDFVDESFGMEPDANAFGELFDG